KEKLRNVTKAFWKVGDRVDGGPKEGAGVASVKVDYAPGLIVKEAVKFIGQNKAKPFFLYLALNTPHANNEGGNDKEQRDGMEVPDYGQYSDKDWPNPEKGFAKMIEDIDTTVAQVREALQKNGIDDTLIIFTSDNGPHQEGQHKMEFFNSNGDLRGMKRDLTDGGVRVPMIAFWDGKIQPGAVTDHLSGFQDFLPTVAEIIGVEPPVDTDGLSYLPTLTGRSDLQKQHEFLYWEFSEKGGKIGVTDGKWKAIRRNFVKNPDAPVELYDLAADPSESTDVAKQYPEVVEKMKQRMGEAHREL
ncbi:MAG: sulfatase-like hydrolase/transferase, partial [Verrucomicrobiales bacterium]|nr:sulfatase-like hydrolase/transferase [Verrucomicrobiales bacterium]